MVWRKQVIAVRERPVRLSSLIPTATPSITARRTSLRSVLTPRRDPGLFRTWGNDRSNSALDRRHRFTLALIYDVPYFKSGNAEEERSGKLGSWAIYT